jgi:type VI secretion system secreted protein VgrG
VTGSIFGPPDANQALTDITTAVGYLKSLAVTEDLSNLNLGGRTLGPGVYDMSNDPALLSGKLTLDAENKPNALFVFRLAAALTTDSNSVVDVINGTPGTGVYWVLGSAATLGSGSTFEGNILAYSSIGLGATAKILCGRALALNESVTLIDNVISDSSANQDCNDFGSYGFSNSLADTQGVPEPETLTLFSLGLGAGFLLLCKFRSTR